MSKDTKSITIMWGDIKVPLTVDFEFTPGSKGIHDEPAYCEEFSIEEVYGGNNQDVKCYENLCGDAVSLVYDSLIDSAVKDREDNKLDYLISSQEDKMDYMQSKYDDNNY